MWTACSSYSGNWPVAPADSLQGVRLRDHHARIDLGAIRGTIYRPGELRRCVELPE